MSPAPTTPLTWSPRPGGGWHSHIQLGQVVLTHGHVGGDTRNHTHDEIVDGRVPGDRMVLGELSVFDPITGPELAPEFCDHDEYVDVDANGIKSRRCHKCRTFVTTMASEPGPLPPSILGPGRSDLRPQ